MGYNPVHQQQHTSLFVFLSFLALEVPKFNQPDILAILISLKNLVKILAVVFELFSSTITQTQTATHTGMTTPPSTSVYWN